MHFERNFSESYERRFTEIMQNADKSQLERFKEAARELETDDDEERFNEKLGKLAKQKPASDDASDKD